MSRTSSHSELLTHILAIGQQMSEIRSLLPLLDYVLDKVLALIGGETGYVFLANAKGKLVYQIGKTKDGQLIDENPHTLSTTILNDAFVAQETVRVGNAMLDERFGTAVSVQQLQLRSVICTPLVTQNRAIGVIYIENNTVSGRFKHTDVPPLEILANQAAVSIDNARLNDQLERANYYLQELNDLKNNFIMLISHELRTPLTSVSIYADLLRTSLSQESEQQAYAMSERLETSIQTLDKIIQEIIDVFRIMSGRLDLTKTNTELSLIIDTILIRLGQTIETRNLEINTSNLDNLPIIQADETHLQTIFQNILSNAIKYTPNGGRIWIDGQTTAEQQILLTIRDEGIGIPVAEQKRVFDLFHGLGSLLNHSTSKANFRGGGLGLGLPIAKGLVEAHQGDIWLTSVGYDGQNYPGTTCHICLPIA